MFRNRTFFSILVILISLIVFQSESEAIPYFARKYKTSCSTCHDAITKRNPSGEAFRRNGYRIPLKETRVTKEKPVPLGAEAWKELWPDAVWPGSLPASFPLAAFTLMRLSQDFQEQNKGNRTEFVMPVFFNLLFGGTFGEDVSFFGEWSAFSAGVNARGLQRLFIQLNDVIGPPNHFNVRIGRFEPGITDGYVSTQRMTSSEPITLGYNPSGGWSASDPQSGIELNGIINHRFYYAAGIVNGESKTIADPGDQKDFYGRIAYQFGGEGYDGKDIGFDSTAVRFTETFVAVGANAYFGSRNKIPMENVFYDNYFRRFSLDINLHLHDFDIYSGCMFGRDDNPFNDNLHLNSSAFFVEGSYNFYPWLIGLLRYERAASWVMNNDIDNYSNLIPALIIVYRANIRFSIESLIRIEADRQSSGKLISAVNKDPLKFLTLNLMFAF